MTQICVFLKHLRPHPGAPEAGPRRSDARCPRVRLPHGQGRPAALGKAEQTRLESLGLRETTDLLHDSLPPRKPAVAVQALFAGSFK